MLKRSWVFVAAFGLAVTVSGQAYSQEEYGQDGAPEEQEQSESPTFAIPVQIIESQEAAIARDSSEREAEDREINDLLAQQGMHEAADAMNSATEDMALYSLVSTITVIVGTGLLFWTLALTRQANRAARDAVDVTREIGRDQARAYVDVDSVKFYWGSDAGQWPEIYISLRNSGATPAKWHQIRQSYVIYDHAIDAPFGESFGSLPLQDGFSRRWNGIPARESGQRTPGPKVHNVNDVKKCLRLLPKLDVQPKDNTHGIAVFGEIRYCTVFDEIYISQFFYGLSSLEPFKSKAPELIDSRVKNGRPYTLMRVEEIPQTMSRFPTILELYKAEKQGQ